MAAQPTNHLLDQVAVPTTSATIYPQRVLEDYGTVQVESGATTFVMQVLGRSSPEAPWAILATITQADLDGSGGAVFLVALLPEMALDLTALSNASFDAWLNE